MSDAADLVKLADECRTVAENTKHIWSAPVSDLLARCERALRTAAAQPVQGKPQQPAVAMGREALIALLNEKLWLSSDDGESVDIDPSSISEAADAILALSRPSPAALDAGTVEVKSLVWHETFVDRGDGSKEVNGWEADSGFGYYLIEMYMGSDSYGFELKFDCEVIADHDDPDQAKASAQSHFAKRIISALANGSGS
jgi:hypothetical protein